MRPSFLFKGNRKNLLTGGGYNLNAALSICLFVFGSQMFAISRTAFFTHVRQAIVIDTVLGEKLIVFFVKTYLTKLLLF